MPTYEYACKSCGQHLEVVQSFSVARLTECPSCGGALRKVFGSIGIAFKGSGFYKTDSRSAAKSGAGSSKPAAETKSGDSKPSSDSPASSSKADAGGSTEKKAADTGGSSKEKSA